MGKSEKRRFKRMRAKVLAENRGICTICNQAPATTLDHILPRAAGGTNERHNLRGACPDCNTKKGCQVPPGAPQPGKGALAERRRARTTRTRYTPKTSARSTEPDRSPWNGEWLLPLGDRARFQKSKK